MAISNIAIVVISTHTSLAGGDQVQDLYGGRASISTHTSLAGGDIQSVPFRCPGGAFQPTPPSREATTKVQQDYAASLISTHTSLAGGDAESVHLRRSVVNFNPHLPRGRRLKSNGLLNLDQRFQPTPPSREATPDYLDIPPECYISTHTSLAGGDGKTKRIMTSANNFNPHLPRGRRPYGTG